MPKIMVRDIQLYYEESGSGQPLVFIHGLGSSTRDWQLQIEAFSKDYRVIAFDVRGHGQSDKPPGPYSVKQFAEDTAALFDTLGIEPAHIVGVSMGGMIAFQLAVSHPACVATITIVNSGPELIPRTLPEKLSVYSRILIVQLLGMRRMGEVLAKRLFIKPEQEELRQLFIERWAENDKRAYLDSLRALIGWSVSDYIGHIDCPTLVIAADEDYSPLALKEAYVAKMQNAELQVIEDSRHATPIEKPEVFNTVLDGFLAKQG